MADQREQSEEKAPTRNEITSWLVQHDPDPCDPVHHDAAAYYRDFANALIESGWQITRPATGRSDG